MTAARLTCAACGTDLRENAKFCDECGASVAAAPKLAEYKQVTVLFADVVRSMDIAAAVGPERLREIMAELFNRSAAVVQRYGGTLDKFTGDGIMAVFGAPIALEDHAHRACLAALDIQREVASQAVDIESRDGLTLQLRIGLNSGEVIAGEIGSGSLSYTTIGEQVGMAQRMESVAPPGGVMLSESTARLVENSVVLGEPERLHIKGAAEPVGARRLLAVTARRNRMGSRASPLVGRDWEFAALTAMLDRSMSGNGCVAGVVGSPGIGKSRIVADISDIAVRRGAQVFSTFGESHANEIAFHVSTRLLRAALGIEDLDDAAARKRVRAQVPGADPSDIALLDDALGIRDPAYEIPNIAPDARRRRLTALVNAAVLARSEPAVYVIEDAHWIDPVSEALLAEFLTVIPRTRSLVLITYRPEYPGALSRAPGAQTIALAPLDASNSAALTAALLGSDESVASLTDQIAEKAAGNPFFAEEIVRDLADRGVITGLPGSYTCRGEPIQMSVPATLQATIAARIDRLDGASKRTLTTAAVIGSRFSDDLLIGLGIEPVIDELLEAELIDQVTFTSDSEYAFRHPLIRTVAYESQLKSDRAEVHRRLAAAIEQRDPQSADTNAALIAEHLEAAGALHEAFDWHMRAGTWLRGYRDIRAAWISWQRARSVADRLPADDPGRTAMRIAPRTRLCATAWRAGGSVADTGFDELREMAVGADDTVSLAFGMAGQINALSGHQHDREASLLVDELTTLLESIGDPALTTALLWTALTPKVFVGEISECLRLAQHIIDLADGDPHMGDLIIESPLTLAMFARAAALGCLGQPGWKNEFEHAAAMCREINPGGRAPIELTFMHGIARENGLIADPTILDDGEETLKLAEQRGDDYVLAAARLRRGLVLIKDDEPQHSEGIRLLSMARDAALENRFLMASVRLVDFALAKDHSRAGDVDVAIELLRASVDGEFTSGVKPFRGPAVTAFVETLLQRGGDADVGEAEAVIERLAAVSTEPGFVLYEISLLHLRALVARARGDEVTYRTFRDRYRAMATSLGFEGHMALAEAMT
jgi:adenylate cyclase